MISRGKLMLKILEKENTLMKHNEGCQPSKETEQDESSNLKSAVVEVIETDEVQDIFEGEESSSDIFSSDGEEEYQPNLEDLSTSDEDESFELKVKSKSKNQPNYHDEQDEDIILGTDSDEGGFSFVQGKNSPSCSGYKHRSFSRNPLKGRPIPTFDENIANRPNVDVNINLPNDEQPPKKKKMFNLPEKVCKKRERNPELWKKNISKINREQGKAFLSQKGRLVEEKKVNDGMLCNEKCRFHCSTNLPLERRVEIFSSFYKLDINSKNNLLFKSIVPIDVKRPKKNAVTKKRHSYKFYVRSNMEDVRVCKKALCTLYQISMKKIDLLQTKIENGASAPPPDQRGRHMSRPHKVTQDVKKYVHDHIKSFPAESSHYSRHKNAHKKYLSPLLNLKKMYDLYINLCDLENKPQHFQIKLCTYRNIFNKDFNLSFGNPRSDTCSTCDAGENTEEHESNYKEAFENQKTDREKARLDNKISYVTVDLQQTMPLPRLTTSRAFYLRQLWFYNLGIHIITKDCEKADFCTWTEDIANRGSSEVASSLLTIFEIDSTFRDIDHLIIWSDSCAGQNKNISIILLYQYLILKKRFKTIDHKYPEVGHSYLDSDRDFGQIEKILRKQENVYIPDEYRNIITSASKHNMVIDMKLHFRDFNSMLQKLNLTHRKTDLLEENVRFRDGIKWIRVEEFGSYLYKETYDQCTPFRKVDLLKKTKSSDKNKISNENALKNIFVDRVEKAYGEVSKEKINNLKEQMKFVKEEHRWFYENIFKEHA